MSREPSIPPELDTNGDLERQLNSLSKFVDQIYEYKAQNGLSTRFALKNAMYASGKQLFWDNVCASTHPGTYCLGDFYNLMYETIEYNYEHSTISSSSSTSTSYSSTSDSDSNSTESIADEIYTTSTPECDNYDDYATESYCSDDGSESG